MPSEAKIVSSAYSYRAVSCRFRKPSDITSASPPTMNETILAKFTNVLVSTSPLKASPP
jgi:hypothetical protein